MRFFLLVEQHSLSSLPLFGYFALRQIPPGKSSQCVDEEVAIGFRCSGRILSMRDVYTILHRLEGVSDFGRRGRDTVSLLPRMTWRNVDVAIEVLG